MWGRLAAPVTGAFFSPCPRPVLLQRGQVGLRLRGHSPFLQNQPCVSSGHGKLRLTISREMCFRYRGSINVGADAKISRDGCGTRVLYMEGHQMRDKRRLAYPFVIVISWPGRTLKRQRANAQRYAKPIATF